MAPFIKSSVQSCDPVANQSVLFMLNCAEYLECHKHSKKQSLFNSNNELFPSSVHPIDYFVPVVKPRFMLRYRVTHQFVANLPLISKQMFRFGLAWPGQNGTFVMMSTGGSHNLMCHPVQTYTVLCCVSVLATLSCNDTSDMRGD